MKTVKAFDKRTGTTYVYEVLENKWDPVKKRGNPTRRMIGKIDPLTGEIVPTHKKGGPRKPGPDGSETDLLRLNSDLLRLLHEREQQIRLLEHKNSALEERLQEMEKELSDFQKETDALRSAARTFLQEASPLLRKL